MPDQDFYKNLTLSEREELIRQLVQLNEQTSRVTALVDEFMAIAEERGITWSDVVSHISGVPQRPVVAAKANKLRPGKTVPPEPLTTYVHPDKPDTTWKSSETVRRVPNWLKELQEATGKPYSAFKA